MSEAAPEATPAAPETPDTGEKDWAKEAEKWKALARKHETEAKQYRPAAQELEQLRQSQMTEQQKLEARVSEFEGKVTPLEQENARLKVALAKGIPADLVDRLRGGTVEEIEADADALIALVGGRAPGTPAPPPALDLGNRGGPAVGGPDMNQLLRAATGRA